MAGNATGDVVLASTLATGQASTQLQFNASFAATIGASPTSADLLRFADAVSSKLQSRGVDVHGLSASVLPGSVIVVYTGPASDIGQINEFANEGAITVVYDGQQIGLVGSTRPTTTSVTTKGSHPTAATGSSSGSSSTFHVSLLLMNTAGSAVGVIAGVVAAAAVVVVVAVVDVEMVDVVIVLA